MTCHCLSFTDVALIYSQLSDVIEIYSPSGQCSYSFMKLPSPSSIYALAYMNGFLYYCDQSYSYKCFQYNVFNNSWTDMGKKFNFDTNVFKGKNEIALIIYKFTLSVFLEKGRYWWFLTLFMKVLNFHFYTRQFFYEQNDGEL